MEQRSEFGFISQSLSAALPHFPAREGMVPVAALVFPQLLVWVKEVPVHWVEGLGVQGSLGLVPVQDAPQELV